MTKQADILHNNEWYHIIITMLPALWDLLLLNKYVFNQITKLAADCIITIASILTVILTIFTTLNKRFKT